jgi:hypothetical protein
MPIVKQMKGDLVGLFQEGSFNLVAVGTNCRATMKGDLFNALAERFPDLTEVDKEFPLPTLYRLGDYAVCPTEFGNILIFYTELESEGSFEYSALKSCLKKLSNEAIRANTYLELAVPMFVNEANSAKWEIVKRILNFQEHLLITVIEQDDKGEVRLGETEAD